MKKRFLLTATLVTSVLSGCGFQETAENEASTETETQTQDTASGRQGTLAIVANGEDFVRQGFVTKDGWQVDFKHVYVTLDKITAYQTNPTFDPEQSGELKATEEVTLLERPQTVDLAEGDENAAPLTITTEKAPSGTYNALAWEVVKADRGPAQGSTIVLEGTAQKEGQTIDFTLNFDQPLAYTCGQYVGDERKGILKGSQQAELETTFHFDHIFGDADAPADDPLNQEAVGFEPFAALTETQQIDGARLEQELSPENYQKLQEAIFGIGHVGEGHCRIESSVPLHNHE